MIRIREQGSLDGDRVHAMRQTSLGSIKNGVTLNYLKHTLDEWHEPLGMTTVITDVGVGGVENSLSFLSIKSAIRDYPDTGESGDAYDAEAPS